MTVTDGGQNVLKSVGTGTDFSGNFYRNANSLSNGQSVSVDFKVDYTDTVAHFAVETTGSPVMRWAVQAITGTLRVQYNTGAGWVYPKDLINPVKANTWYRLTLRVDDLNGFRIELRERDGGAASATYTFRMPLRPSRTTRPEPVEPCGSVHASLNSLALSSGNIYNRSRISRCARRHHRPRSTHPGRCGIGAF